VHSAAVAGMLARYGDALPLLQKAVSRAPEMAHGRYMLAMTYARLENLERRSNPHCVWSLGTGSANH
jgi:hypothetical protein